MAFLPLEVHFFHGFLGMPEDWLQLEKCLILENQKYQISFVRHNLWDDFLELKSAEKESGKELGNFFESWAQAKKNDLESTSIDKVLVGYSLGGRLLMHLPLDSSSTVKQSCSISSHPGLHNSRERQARFENDFHWGTRFLEEDWSAVLKGWNQQKVFSNDSGRPIRLESRYSKVLLQQVLQDWSLAKQEPRDQFLSTFSDRTSWFFGERDEGYAKLAPRISKAIGTHRCFKILNGGHGLIWSEPQSLAKALVSLWN